MKIGNRVVAETERGTLLALDRDLTQVLSVCDPVSVDRFEDDRLTEGACGDGSNLFGPASEAAEFLGLVVTHYGARVLTDPSVRVGSLPGVADWVLIHPAWVFGWRRHSLRGTSDSQTEKASA